MSTHQEDHSEEHNEVPPSTGSRRKRKSRRAKGMETNQKKRSKTTKTIFSLIFIIFGIALLRYAGELAFYLVGDQIQQTAITYPVMLFLAMAGGMGITSLLIITLVVLSGPVALFQGTLKPGWVFRSIKRLCFAILMITVGSSAICGTTYLMIPPEDRHEVTEVCTDIYKETVLWISPYLGKGTK